MSSAGSANRVPRPADFTGIVKIGKARGMKLGLVERNKNGPRRLRPNI